MSHSEVDSKITMACPRGHRVRGGADLVGRSVRCPKCRSEFVFAPEKSRSTELPNSRQVSDTGVMRILGDLDERSFDQEGADVVFRPCSRCGVPIPDSLTVCNHCNCYVGVMPTFMKQMSGNITQQS